MNDFAAITEPGTVGIRRMLPGPIECVWAWLTESEPRRKWLASGEMDLRAGGEAHCIGDVPRPCWATHGRLQAEYAQRFDA
ncbi:MAG: SRPBCC domain-containing protein [Lysobacter sp.]